MEPTTEEKIKILQEYEGWGSFTPAQQQFLINMANGMKETEAFMKAYPDTKAKSMIFATQQMLCRVGIKKALSLIGIDKRKPVVSKQEAQELLSTHLRQAKDPEQLVKLLNVYAKISGWDKEKPSKPEEEEVDVDKLVTAVEKKRKANVC